MTDYEVKSADGTYVSGRIFHVDAPKAVVSLVHGFGEHCGRYAPMAEALNAQNIAVVAIDLRGHGRSDGKRGACKDYESYRQDLDALLSKTRDLYPDVPQFLFGHSMGGGLVLNHSLTRGTGGLKGVISQAPLILLPDPPPALFEKIVRGLAKLAPNMTLGNKLEAHKISSLKEEQDKYIADPLNHGALTAGLAVGMIDGGRWVLSQAGQWPDTPLLLMHAKEDQLTACAGTEAFASQASTCEFVSYEDVEHEIHNDTTRAQVYAKILSFIESQL